MTQRDGVLALEVFELRRIRVVRRLAVRDRERGLPDPRVEPERMLEPRGSALAEEARALLAITLELGPADAGVLARRERAHAEQPRDVGREADRRERAAVAAQLVHAERRDHLLDPLAERLDEIRRRVGVPGRDRVLEEQVRRDRIRAEPERDHQVVQVADASRAQHDRAVAAQRPGARSLAEQRAVHRRRGQERIDPRTALVRDRAVLDDDEPRARADRGARGRADAGERIAQTFLPVAVRLKDGGGTPRLAGKVVGEIVEHPGAEPVRERSRLRRRESRARVVAAEEDRDAQLDPRPRRAGAVRRGTRTEHDARREVLDLPLTVDRRVRDDRDRLLQVVGEVRTAARDRCERAVVAERPDRLASGLRHVRGRSEVLGLVAQRGETLLPGDRMVVDLVGGRGDLHAAVRAASARRQRVERPSRLEAHARAREADRVTRAGAQEALAQRVMIEHLPPAARALEAGMLARPERPWIRHISLERYEAALAREDVLLVGLDVPQRAQSHGIDAEEAEIVEAREERGRALRERPEGGARVGVRVLEAVRQPADLVHDRREHELDRLDRIEPEAVDEPAQQRVDILRIAALADDRHAEGARLLAEATDGVDLAVVSEGRERLHAREGARGVRRVPVVAEGRGGAEARIAEVGVVRDELPRGAAELVPGRRARKAHDGRRRARLDLHGREMERPVAAMAPRWGVERELPEAWLLRTAAREERRRGGRGVPLEDDADAMRAEDSADRRIGLVRRVARDEEVPHGEAGVGRERAGEPGVGEMLGPERARDVDEDARAVSLPVDLAGAVRHAFEPVQDEGERVRTGTPVLARDGDERAGVAFVSAPRAAVHRRLLSLPLNKKTSRREASSRRLSCVPRD